MWLGAPLDALGAGTTSCSETQEDVRKSVKNSETEAVSDSKIGKEDHTTEIGTF